MKLIQDREPQRVRLLMLFPSMPNGFALNWDFDRNIREQFGEQHGDEASFKPHHIRRVDPNGASLAFDHLVGQTANRTGEIILALLDRNQFHLQWHYSRCRRNKMTARYQSAIRNPLRTTRTILVESNLIRGGIL